MCVHQNTLYSVWGVNSALVVYCDVLQKRAERQVGRVANFDVDVHLISPDFHLHKNHDARLQRSEIKLSRLSVDAKGGEKLETDTGSKTGIVIKEWMNE